MRSVHKLGQLTAGQVLVAGGRINPEQLQELVQEQQGSGERVTDIAIERGMLTEFDIAKAMVRHLQLPFVNPASYDIADDTFQMVPPDLLREHRIVPLDVFGSVLSIATCGDLSSGAIKQVEMHSSCRVALFISLQSEIDRVIEDRCPAPVLGSNSSMGEEVASRLDQLFGA